MKQDWNQRPFDEDKWKALPPVGVLGIEGSVGPEKSANLYAEPNVPIIVRGFIVDPECAPHFDIEELTIGRMTLFLSSGRVPASVFSGDKCRECALVAVNRIVGTAWPKLNAGCSILVGVRNRTQYDRIFRATFECQDLSFEVQDALKSKEK